MGINYSPQGDYSAGGDTGIFYGEVDTGLPVLSPGRYVERGADRYNRSRVSTKGPATLPTEEWVQGGFGNVNRILSGEGVVFFAGSDITALEKDLGVQLWSIDGSEVLDASLIGQNLLVVQPAEPTPITLLGAQTGNEIWSIDNGEFDSINTPARTVGETMFINGGQSGATYILKYDVSDGSFIDKFAVPEFDGVLALTKNLVIVDDLGDTGGIEAYTHDGSLSWGSTPDKDSNVLVDGQHVYFSALDFNFSGDNDYRLIKLSRTDGSVLYNNVVGVGGGTGITVSSSESKIIVTTANGDVFAVNKETGSQVWETSISAETAFPPVVDGERIYYPNDTGQPILALDVDTGSEVYSFSPGGSNSQNIVPEGGALYISQDTELAKYS